MKILSTFIPNKEHADQKVHICSPENEKEIQELYDFRYRVYVELGYINPLKYQEDIDDYDKSDCSHYCVSDGNSVFGYVRLIKSSFLPAFHAFSFEMPVQLTSFPEDEIVELSRLIVLRCPRFSIPRHFVMLFLFRTILEQVGDVKGGVAYVKSTLLNKLNKLRFPIHTVGEYTNSYTEQDVLYPYFTQQEDPAIPIYFTKYEVNKYINKMLNPPLVRKNIEGEFEINNSMYSRLLVLFRII
ncbi:hypothetical protein CO180_01780 [candidate division WWE3 bacterium CG_4_9_14_3_um_filter_41_6]|uniref:GNAT family N-acetyltransferase n=1 Tax=candidate division WWE3 bacterium CG_4_10_14_0_2_um_filter_41_14 TaxID=1975072 RepID=A0A2M7TF33_UNCKA|nr:MAG: hypothetical protein COY32_06650 [candidate division WWE3 bacterium CG_4_10_14_0_2_um_filter_41_14]PJA38999.1 MAG: hypothetical protein CO180_01780 [candidate division WWE3 bacterium CG_4_9_14_3_um_filter_41_6]